jgi:hypothetical protein
LWVDWSREASLILQLAGCESLELFKNKICFKALENLVMYQLKLLLMLIKGRNRSAGSVLMWLWFTKYPPDLSQAELVLDYFSTMEY